MAKTNNNKGEVTVVGMAFACFFLMLFALYLHYFFHINWTKQDLRYVVKYIIHHGVPWQWNTILLIFLLLELFILFLLSKEIIPLPELFSPPNEYGNARFSTHRDLKKRKLLQPYGVVLGAFHGKQKLNKIVGYQDNLSAFLLSPAGQGKTFGVVIPTLLNANNRSIIAHDIKGELYERTAGYRSRIGKVIRLAWGDKNSEKWNPLSPEFLPQDDDELQLYITNIIEILLTTGNTGDQYWADIGKKGMIALLFYMCQATKRYNLETNFAQVLSTLQSAFDSVDEVNDEEENTQDLVRDFFIEMGSGAEDSNMPKWCTRDLKATSQTNKKELSTAMNMIFNGFRVFGNQIVSNNISETSFTFDELRGIGNDQKPLTIYVCVPVKDVSTYARLTSLFFELVVDHLISETDKQVEKGIQVLFLIDEFPQLGKNEKMMRTVPEVGRGKKLSLFAIAQSWSQVTKVYGRDDTEILLNNAGYIVTYRQNSNDEKNKVSTMIGNYTRYKVIYSKQTKQLEGVPLVTPQDVGSLRDYHSLVLINGMHNRPIQTTGVNPEIVFKNRIDLDVVPYVEDLLEFNQS